MLSVGYNNRHAMWRYPHAGSVTQYRRLPALTMENCANYISKTMQMITRPSGQDWMHVLLGRLKSIDIDTDT